MIRTVQGLEASASKSALLRDVEDAIRESAGAEHAASRVLQLVDGGFQAIALDNARLLAEMKEANFQLNYRVWEMESLYDIGLAITSTLDLDELVDQVLLRSIELLNAQRGALFLRQGEDFVLAKSFGMDESLPELLTLDPDERRILLEESRELTVNRGACRFVRGSSHTLAVPIESEKATLGILAVGDKESRSGALAEFGPADARVLKLFGNQAAIAMENARRHRDTLEKERLEHEMCLAAEIQRAILPRDVPLLSGIDLAATNRPTRQVGGDYYDWFPHPDGRLGIVVADVSGKGVPAALLVSTLHSSIHMQIGVAGDLAELCNRLNEHIFRYSSSAKFISLIVLWLDAERRRLSFVNAGHNPGLLERRDGSLVQLASSGTPLGMLAKASYHVEELTIGPGDRLLLYTDGINEAADAADREFGMDRLIASLANSRGTSAETLESIFADLQEFCGAVPPADDQTVVIARITS